MSIIADIPGDTNKTCYKIVAIDRAGNASDTCVSKLQIVISTGVEEDHFITGGFSLAQNTPNPFNNGTEIRYTLPQVGESTLIVFSLEGRVVRELVHQREAPGDYRVVWDGTDRQGRLMANGIHVYRLTYAGMQMSRRMLLLR